ncbi:immunoglobulin-like domain-containing receptor 2 isoform X3 [Ictalurus furcatus]|uniref:immunoglobulin-like domain-containing receptor 2 isoform X3 n=1 Tax=Ictalurus furcatus TaxID=66913 RepID=UPI002350F5B2|nr:immunoglobulin-like domain-containing receptor 2 isoform X3 [Ictalurus furcatus]
MLTHLPGGHEHEANSGSGGITAPGSLCAFIWTMRFIPSHWIPVVLISGLTCDCVHVTVKDEKKFAMLFSSVVLQCQYKTQSTNLPTVQWQYKSYCTDRTRESFTFLETLGVHGSNLGAKSHLDCSDASRTVQIVASKQGNSLTLANQYKGRDISIINKADLRIGALHWGDSGVYVCRVISSDDLEGKNEDQVELLVLGKTGVLNDVLPEFELEVMPEWAFVGSVVVGSVLLLVVLGVCWCQCCPHSCCCYVRCCCCPDTCCCPKHLYEAGKNAKSGGQPPQIAMYPPYYGVPMVPRTAPSLIEPKVLAAPPSVENNTARAGSVSELSSLHDGDVDFRQTYRQVQKKALPPIRDPSNESQFHTASTAHRLRPTHCRSSRTEEQPDSRWNCRSEHLPRKAFDTRGRTGSLDELEEFARNYGHRAGRRGDFHDFRDPEQDFDMELRCQNEYRPRGFRNDDDDDDDDANWRRHSPPLPPQRGHYTSSERYGTRRKSYNDVYLTSVLERKARGQGECGGRVDEDSDTPSKSSKKNSDCYYSRSSNRPEEDESLPPYCEVDRCRTEEPAEQERCRTMEPATRPFSYTRPNQSMSHTLQDLREDKNKPRKLTTHLSRDSLIV